MAWIGDVESGQIQLNNVLRRNANVMNGDSVLIKRVDIGDTTLAQSIVIKCVSDEKLMKEPVFRTFCQQIMLDIYYFRVGQFLRILFRGKSLLLKIENIIPEAENQIYRIGPTTSISDISRPKSVDPNKKQEFTFARIGGLDTEIAAIKETLDMSLLRPEKLARYGLKPSRGVLLYGPPGTGKTLIAKTISEELNVNFVVINGPEILSGLVGESESKLRSIFEEAIEKQPSIIFIDEIDSLCPKRKDSATGTEKRLVSCLLTLMDGASSASSKFMVLAATNRPDSLDEALRRPGRFDKEIEIGIPSPSQRLQILQALFEQTPNDISDALLKEISEKTHGYVGADLKSLFMEASVNLLSRIHAARDLSDLEDGGFRLNVQDIDHALSKVRPSAMREISLQVPHVKWEDIGGQEEIKKRLQEAIEWPLKHPESFERLGIKPPKGILLYGPPGCSKTLLAKALATESGVNFLAVKGPELFNKYVGESERAVREIFKKARASSPSIIFFDEIDAIASRRGGDGGVSVGDRVLSQLLTELDGMEALSNVTIVAATNRPDIMDAALLRPGRLDRILYVSPPDSASRQKILEIQKSKMAFDADVNVQRFVEVTEGFSGAEMVALCQEAGFRALERDAETITNSDFENAFTKIKPQITPELIDFYDKFMKQSGLKRV